MITDNDLALKLNEISAELAGIRKALQATTKLKTHPPNLEGLRDNAVALLRKVIVAEMNNSGYPVVNLAHEYITAQARYTNALRDWEKQALRDWEEQ